MVRWPRLSEVVLFISVLLYIFSMDVFRLHLSSTFLQILDFRSFDTLCIHFVVVYLPAFVFVTHLHVDSAGVCF